MLKRNLTLALILLLMIPVLVSAQHLNRPLAHKTPVAVNDPTGIFKVNPNPGKTLADGNYIAVDTMTNGLGPAIATLNPVVFDPYSGTACWFHRSWNGHYGATSSGELYYNISTNFGVTWSRVPNGVNVTSSQLQGRYPSMGLSNPAKGPIAGTTAFFSWPEVVAGAFGGVGYAADQPAGAGAGASFIDMGTPNAYSSQTTCWASDITSDMFWAADYSTGAAIDLWTTPGFGTITKTSPPQWSDSVFQSGGVIPIGGQSWHGIQYYAVLGTFNQYYAPNPISFGWYPGVSKSTDNGATWSNYDVCDFRKIPKLASYDELFNFTGSAYRWEGDMHVDKNGHPHIIVELADTSVDQFTYNKVALVDLFKTNSSGWDATIITTAIDPSSANIWMNATDMGVGQMGPSPYIAFDSTRNIMAVQFNNKGASGYADIFLTHKLLNDTAWSTPVNLTNSGNTDNIQTHLASFLRTVTSGTNVECTAFSYYGYELGNTGPLGNGNNPTVGYMGAEKFTVTLTNTPILSVMPSSSNVTAVAGTTNFSVSNIGSGNMSYTSSVMTGSSWCHITGGSSGTAPGTINIDYDANTGTSSRTATITVTATGATGSPESVQVVQGGTSSILITSPVGGESWQVGSSHNITWTSSNVTNVKIEYTSDNGTNWGGVIVSTSASAGSYSWTIPNTPSTLCKVRISDAGNASTNSVSANVFTIFQPALTITSPVGGESWQVGSSHNITWTSSNVTNAKIEYTIDNGINWGGVIVSTSASAGSYSWTIPNTASTQCKVRISDVSNTSLISISTNVFTIYSGCIPVTIGSQPQNQTVPIGNSANFSVSVNGDAPFLYFWYKNDTQILGATSSSYTTPTLTASDNGNTYKCIITNCNSTNQVVSNYAILTVTGVISISSPSGGESWQVGTSHNITWTSSNVTNATIEYTTDNGTSWTTVTASTLASAGSYSWTIPNTPSSLCKVRISDASNASLNSVSNNVFSITTMPVPTISITSPVGGESWQVGSSHNITWTSSNVTNVKIEYTTDNGSNWSTVIASTAATAGNYSWTIPNTPSTQCRVKISDASNGATNNISANVFTIYQPALTITSPVGGESWQLGTSHNITWTSSNVTNATIEYTTDNGTSWTTVTASTLASAGSYSWTIPNTPSSLCKVRISDASNASLNSVSNNVFSITTAPVPTISITAPVGGESWQVGTSHNITWTSSNVTNAKIEYTTDNGSNWSTLITSTSASSGSYSWTIPNTPSTQCKVRISDVSNDATNNISANVFTIYQPALTITSPAGGENWQVGTSHNITWTSSNVTNVKIEYTIDNGTSWSTVIASTTASAGSYSWTIPNTPSTVCKVRISDAANASTNSISANVFTIYQPALTITSPVGGESWQVGTSHNILWTSSNVTNVKIEYSTDSGSNWSAIIASTTASTGSYSWTIPNTISSGCKVRISDYANLSLNSISSNTFTIWKYPDTITLNTNVTFGDQSKSESYKLIGLPGDSTLPLAQVFTGTYKTDWRAFYDNGASFNFIVEYDGSTIFTFKPGNGFWALSKNAMSVSKNINSVPLQSDATYSIPLHSGWNIISNPFDQSVSWSNVLTVNGLASNNVIYNWSGTWQQPSVMSLYEGYYYNNINTLSNLKIPYQPNGTGSAKISLKQISKTSSDPAIKLSLYDGNVETGYILASFNNNASDNFDEYDFLAPPDNFQSRGITIVNDKLLKSWDKFMIETREAVADGQEYNIRIKNLYESGLLLSAEGLNKFKGYQVYIVDMHLYKFYDLAINNIIKIPGNISGNNYKLLIGPNEFIQNEKATLVPAEFRLYQNYPNPFNPATTISFSIVANSHVKISIYNSLGELVKELLNSNLDLGYHEVQLDGSKLASGVYFYSVNINSVDGKQNFRQTKKMILLK